MREGKSVGILRGKNKAITQHFVDENGLLQYNKNMKNNTKKTKLQKHLTRQLVVSVVFTLLLPIGVVLTVLGARGKDDGGALYTAMMSIGIIFMVLGFYGSPIAWVRYAPQKKYARIIDAIKREGFRDANEIANHLSMQPIEVVGAIRTCIDKQYLTDYTIDGNTVLPINNRPDDLGMYTIQCPYCGGITKTSNNLQVRCEYCGRMLDVEKK